MDSLALALVVGWRGWGVLRRALAWSLLLILVLRLLTGSVRRASRRCVSFDLAAVLQLVLTICDHDISRLKSRADSYRVARGERDRDRLDLYGIVFLHQIDIRALRAALNRGSGHNRDVALRVHQEVNVHKLVGKENVFIVVKNAFQFVGAGARVDLIVDGEKLAAGDFRGVLAVVGIHGKLPSVKLAQNLRELILR